jgi:hypothetical protein
MADTGPAEPDTVNDAPPFTMDDFTKLDYFEEVTVCEARLTLTGASGEAYELLCEVDDERHDEHEATLRWRTEPVGRVVDVPRAEP